MNKKYQLWTNGSPIVGVTTQRNVPSSKGLFESIQRLLQLIDMIGLVRIYKTSRLNHKDLYKSSIKKCIVYIMLPKGPSTRKDNSEIVRMTRIIASLMTRDKVSM